MADETPEHELRGRDVAAVVFDLGGVLIDWDPRHLYRKIFSEKAEMEHFLTEVFSSDWNEQADGGRPTAEITAELCALHPDKRPLIEAYYERFPEMMKGAIDGTVSVVERLHEKGLPLFVLSNFSAETFPYARRRFAFFERFSGMVISGEVGMKKPEPRIYDLLTERYGLTRAQTLFIDDRTDNAAAARQAGWQALHFTSPDLLTDDLKYLGLLD